MDGGAGGAGGSTTTMGLELRYEGELRSFETDNTCLINRDAVGGSFSTVTVEGSSDDVALTLQSETLDVSVLLERGSLIDAELLLLGTLALSDFDAGLSQFFGAMDAPCAVDISFLETVQGAIGEVEKYEISFDCVAVPYDLVNVSMMFVGMGTLTDLVGRFECIVTPLMVGTP
jgi:hypothetical protein